MNVKRREINKEYEVLSIDDERYPNRLRQIPNAPQELYYIGDLSLLDEPMFAVVGSRKHGPYGTRITKKLAARMAALGAVLVSGMAMGIDSVGHRAILEERGKTIAVLGNGIDTPYPASNRDLYYQIAEQGLILSEYLPGTKPARYTFPHRNRIISGLSLATVVVEAGLNSGSLITCEHAAAQGRPVYAVPGYIDGDYSIGTNLLIRDGAMPLIVLDDLFRDFGLITEKTARALPQNLPDLSAEERTLVELLQLHGEMDIAAMPALLHLPAARVNGLLGVLEIKGVVATALGKAFLDY